MVNLYWTNWNWGRFFLSISTFPLLLTIPPAFYTHPITALEGPHRFDKTAVTVHIPGKNPCWEFDTDTSARVCSK
jgi:hypothetical protein